MTELCTLLCNNFLFKYYRSTIGTSIAIIPFIKGLSVLEFFFPGNQIVVVPAQIWSPEGMFCVILNSAFWFNPLYMLSVNAK
jgi:hypothetical protein